MRKKGKGREGEGEERAVVEGGGGEDEEEGGGREERKGSSSCRIKMREQTYRQTLYNFI